MIRKPNLLIFVSSLFGFDNGIMLFFHYFKQWAVAKDTLCIYSDIQFLQTEWAHTADAVKIYFPKFLEYLVTPVKGTFSPSNS